MAIDYTPRYKDYARYTTATSEMYTRLVAQKVPKREFPFPKEDLNFLDPNCKLFHVPFALYSAGQAAKSDSSAAKRDCMFTMRDRTACTIIGDSGGYQIETGAIKWKGDETRNRMLRWLEDVTDWSMILDFPTGGINLGSVDPHRKRLESEGYDVRGFCESLGLDPNDYQKISFATCLMQTLQNNDYFAKHRRPGKTKFLNVIQGRNIEESDIWYNAVKHYDFEAWSFAGPHKENFELTVRRLIMMREEGQLNKKDWLHILGVGRLENGAAYTTMQRCIRESVNKNFTISYDVSSPFTLAAYGKCFYGFTLDKNSWALHGDKVDDRNFLPGGKRAKLPFLDYIKELWDQKGLKEIGEGGYGTRVLTEVGKRLTMDQICVNSELHWTSTWDVVAYGLMMNHNLQVHLEAVLHAQDVYDKDDKDLVPQGMLVLKDVIQEIFATKGAKALDVITKYRKQLNYLAGDTAERGVQVLSDFNMPNVSSYNDHLEKISNGTITKPKLELVSDIFM
jgi:hypothetical protein